MSAESDWPKIAVVGAGAVGGYFGGMLARAGAPVVFIGRPAFVEAVNANDLFLDTVRFRERVKVQASGEPGAVKGAGFVLFCVKTLDTAETARAIQPFLSREAIVVSLQNGADNAEEIRRASGIEALAAAVYVAASAPKPGTVKHLGRGDVVVGPENERTRRVAEVFERAQVPCRISENLTGELWTKLLWNCALNALSALGRVTYGEIIASEEARKLVESTVLEVIAVAKASRVELVGLEDPKAAIAGAFKIAEQMSGTRSSTAQDMMRGKKTEIESLNGFIVRRGEKLGVMTPVNQALYTLVKLLEGRQNLA